MSPLKKIYFILNISEKKKILYLSVIIIINFFFEILGIATIPSFITIILNKNKVINFLNDFNSSILLNFKYESVIFFALALIFIIFLIKNLFSGIFILYQNKFTNSVHIRISNLLLSKYLYLAYEKFLEKDHSKMWRNIEEVRTFQTVLLRLLICLSEITILLGIVLVLLFFQFKITVVLILIFLLLLISFQKIVIPKIKKLGESRLFNSERATFYISSALSAYKEVKILSKENFFLDRFNHHNNLAMKSNLYYNFFDNFPKVFLEIIFIAVFVIVVFVMTKIGSSSDEIISVIGLYAAAAFRMLPSVNRIFQSIQNLRYSFPVVDLIYDDLNYSKNLTVSNNEL
jgi:ABC-type bacteriocin/lantibiotic exporter with double-glycine peptidase domain